MDTIITFLLDKYPYLIIALVVGLSVWLCLRYHYTQVVPAKNNSQKSCDKLDKLPCNTHETNIKTVDGSISKLTESVNSIKDMLTEVTKWMMKFDSNTIDVFMQKHSPYQLTPIGKQILDESKGKDTIDSNLDFFIEALENHNPTTAFDVEDRSMDVIINNIGNDIFNDVKNYVYYSPDMKEFSIEGEDPISVRISMPPLLRSMSIYLRDKYFEKYPNIQDPKWTALMNKHNEK